MNLYQDKTGELFACYEAAGAYIEMPVQMDDFQDFAVSQGYAISFDEGSATSLTFDPFTQDEHPFTQDFSDWFDTTDAKAAYARSKWTSVVAALSVAVAA